MDWMKVLGFVALILCAPGSPSKALSGQRICKRGTNKPCYKIGYFEENRRKLNFEEAKQTCRRDGGELLSIESPAEQHLIEGLIQELKASDGDFWIGLRRESNYEENSGDCASQYYWLDGSQSTFRNWHWDEPSCGYEVCVVMYHQPSAPPGLEGLYMFQWNDDNCETKNNFICKYTKDRSPVPPAVRNTTRAVDPEVLPTAESPRNPPVMVNDDGMSVVSEHTDNALNVTYIILPTIPLLLLLIVANGVFCFKLCSKRKDGHEKLLVAPWATPLSLYACDFRGKDPSIESQPTGETTVSGFNHKGSNPMWRIFKHPLRPQRRKEGAAPPPEERCHWAPGERCNSPSPDVYNVIRRQHEADLSETRPQTKNTSFLGSSPDTPTGEYENLGTKDTESGFVTLASTESGFVTNEIYDPCHSRCSSRYYRENSWLENELYGY